MRSSAMALLTGGTTSDFAGIVRGAKEAVIGVWVVSEEQMPWLLHPKTGLVRIISI